MSEEILDLVDENDQVIGALSRTEIYAQALHNYRVVHGFLVNAKGEIWIPKRTAQKKIYPNALDYSVAGHVESGETYEQSFLRETQEELNIDLTKIPWRELGKLTPTTGAHCFQMMYEIQSDETPEYNPTDFSEAHWMRPEQAVSYIESGAYAKGDLAMTIKKYYL